MSRRPSKPERKSRATDPEDDLPTLEELADELEELPAADDAAGAAVKISCDAAEEPGFDTVFTIEVPPMEKQAMPAAVEAPLRRSAAAAAARVRHHRVAVVFLGDTIIGTAVKDTCGAVLEQAKARKVVVRRGYGDELVHEGEPPRVQIRRTVDGGVVRVEVETGELDAEDLPMALQPELVSLASSARGQSFEFAFRGNARPDSSMRQLLARTLGDAGAMRATVGQRVLFDRELEDRVKLETAGDVVSVAVMPAEQIAQTEEALAMVLGPASERLQGKVVRLQFVAEPSAQVRRSCIDYCVRATPRRVELSVADGGADIVWPPLLEVTDSGDRIELAVRSSDRERAGVVAALRREVADLEGSLRGKEVALDWPAGTVFDVGLEQTVLETFTAHEPRALWCTVAAGDRVVLWPRPVTLAEDGPVRTIRIDTDAGKPQELLAAFERWLPLNQVALRSRAVRVGFGGAAAPSRTMTRSVLQSIEQTGAVRVEVDDHGEIDVISPRLLDITGSVADGWRVVASVAGRSAAQVELALQRELDSSGSWLDSSVTLVPSALTDRLVTAAIDRGAARVILGGPVPVQVHPRLLAADRSGDQLVLRATPSADPGMTQRQVERELPGLVGEPGALHGIDVTVAWPDAPPADKEPMASLLAIVLAGAPARVRIDEGTGRPQQVFPPVVREHVTALGRNDAVEPPLLMLGIGLGDEPEHTREVVRQLQERSAEFSGRRVLLVPRSDGEDVPGPDADPTLQAARALVDEHAKATLVFAGKDGRGRPHFTVVHSAIDGVAPGAVFADPRRR